VFIIHAADGVYYIGEVCYGVLGVELEYGMCELVDRRVIIGEGKIE
jgi:hypothetical protein